MHQSPHEGLPAELRWGMLISGCSIGRFARAGVIREPQAATPRPDAQRRFRTPRTLLAFELRRFVF